MEKIEIGLFLLLLFPVVFYAQDKPISCEEIKNGIFYNYPKNTSDQYADKRDGDVVHETNLVTGDTSDWRVNWTDNCVYSLKYLNSNIKWDAEKLAFIKKHLLVFEIVNTAAEYYVYKFYVDKVSTIPIASDTMWINPRIVIGSSSLYKRISNPAILKKEHFSDTSMYAVVYLYRPGKLTNSLGNYPVYLDDDIICLAANNSGYMFKIFREGAFEFKSKLFKDASAVKLEIKFGKTYYVKSMIHWTISSRLYNFKLEMANVDAKKGQNEFEEVNFR